MKFLLGLTALAVISSTYVAARSSPPPPTPSPDFECPDMETGYYPHPTNCSSYYHCANGLAWLRECPAGLYFNFRTSECDFPANVDCPSDTTENPELLGVTLIGPAPDYECEANGAFPNTEQCDFFYDCYNGVAWLAQCTEVMLFDLQYSGCNHAELVDCGDRERPDGYPTHRPSTTASPFDCPEPNGSFPDPENCAGYYVCTSGYSHHLTCPDRLVYNIELKLCDHTYNVECGDRPIPDWLNKP